MKKIKIRFINELRNGESYLYIQRKTIFGWKYFTYVVNGDAGSVSYRYNGKWKQGLLTAVIQDIYKTELKHVKIIEYPMIKIY